MAELDALFLNSIQVCFYSYIDQQSYPIQIHWPAVVFKRTILGSDSKTDIQLQAPAIPSQWITIQLSGPENRVDFSILSGPLILMEDGEKIQEGAFFMPQTLIFEGLGELRFQKAHKEEGMLSETPTPPANSAKKLSQGLMKDRYRILRILGEGGFSHVALARDEISGKEVAVKVIHHKVTEDRDLMEKIMDRFFQEMKILIQLDHSNITRILDYGFDHGTWSPFYVMEYVDGKSLAQISAQFIDKDRWNVADLLFIQFLEGLAYLHDRGVVHRDLKPENILVSGSYPDFKVKILDLGLAKMLNIKSYEHQATETEERETFGTPPYMSPEQCLNAKEVTASSDVYSAGILATILYCNQYPYEMNDHKSYEQIHVEEAPSFKRISRLIPSSIYKVVEKALEKKPELRFQNAREMLTFWQKQESSRFFKNGLLQLQRIRGEWLTYLVLLIVSILIFGVIWIYGYRYAQERGWTP